MVSKGCALELAENKSFDTGIVNLCGHFEQ